MKTILLSAAFALTATAALAQAPAAAPAGPVSVAVANPTYVTIPMEITVNKPAAQVWARVGKFCDIGEWLQIAAGCKIISGQDGQFGAVRTVGNEVLVGKTDLSYVYTQTPRADRPYNLYHGSLEAKPMGANTTKIVYILSYDNSMIADKDADLKNRRASFERALNNMKILVEGGTLPPPPPRPATPPAPAPAAK